MLVVDEETITGKKWASAKKIKLLSSSLSFVRSELSFLQSYPSFLTFIQ